jgi:hypothetical protein
LAIHELIVELGDRLYRVERPFGSWPLNTALSPTSPSIRAATSS